MIVQSKTPGRLAAAWLLLAASAAGAEPLTLDRLLKVEDLGATALSPDGRHLVIETRAPYDTAPSFDFDSPDARLGRLMVADLASARPARPLIALEAGAGYTAGPFSPSGRWMIVSRWLEKAVMVWVLRVAASSLNRSLPWAVLSCRAPIIVSVCPVAEKTFRSPATWVKTALPPWIVVSGPVIEWPLPLP